MKKTFYTILFALTTITFNACDDSDSFDPYKSQNNRPFYPTTVSFNSLDNENTQTEKTWNFSYNPNNSIKTYKYEHSVKTNNGIEISEKHTGELTYYTDATGNNWILNKLIVNSTVRELTSTESYNDTITEDVKLSDGMIQTIKTIGQRTYSNGTKEVYSTTRDFTYTDKYCTGSSINNTSGTTTYRYDWGNAQLKKVTVSEQGKNNSFSQQTYNYTYSKRDLAVDYGFNTLAFIYGNMPEIYAAMNLFGETSAYELEGENYNGYRNINGNQYNISPVNRSYAILETTDNITYTADSPNSATYFFTFSNN